MPLVMFSLMLLENQYSLWYNVVLFNLPCLHVMMAICYVRVLDDWRIAFSCKKTRILVCGGINPYTLTAKLGLARIDGFSPPER